MEKFYKLAKPDGWDFYTGNTINYRDNIGKTVKCPKYSATGSLCSSAFIHASREPNQCFIGASIPCSVYEVRGNPIVCDEDKCGFEKLKVVKELNPANIFEWKYEEAINPINPFKIVHTTVEDKHIELLKQWVLVRDSIRNSVRDSVGDSVWNSVRVSVRNSVRVSVGDSVGDSVGGLVRVSVGDSVWDSVWVSVWYSVWDSVWDSVWAYIGYIFSPCITKWMYIDHKPGEYPFQSSVDLWKSGFVPSFDGKLWRLHAGEKAEVVWEGKLDDI